MTRFFILLPAFSFALSCGYLHGRLMASQPAPMRLEPDVRPHVSTIVLTGIQNGRLTGTMEGETRLIVGNVPVVGSGAFSIAAGPLLVHRIEIEIPKGARFVASKRGKKYYPVDAASARGLSPENRLYFETALQAQAAGFIP